MIGDLVKARREELGLSQDELAKKCGYTSRSTINKIEKNINDVNQTKLKVLADALEVDVMYFIKDDTPTIPPRIEEYIKKFMELSPDKQDAIAKYIDFMAREDN